MKEYDDRFGAGIEGEPARRLTENHATACFAGDRTSPPEVELTSRQYRRICSDSPGRSCENDDEIVPLRSNLLQHFPKAQEIFPHAGL